MHDVLDKLIRLQTLDLELQSLHRTIDTDAERREAIDAAIQAKQADVEAERERVAQNQAARRVIEKDLAQVQGRLSKYRDQLMEVKTNKEYHAMQTEIATAEAEVRRQEDRMLDEMVAADEIALRLKRAEADLARARTDAKTAVDGIAEESRRAHGRISAAAAAREGLARTLPADVLATYEQLLLKKGSALVLARDGHCSVCHVRLRPKVYQDVRRNDMIIHCDSCQRILYYVPPPASPAPPAGA